MRTPTHFILLFIFTSLLCFAYRVDFNLSFSPLEWVYAIVFGYVVSIIAYNLDGFFNHYIKKMTDERYRNRSKKRGYDKKNSFMFIPKKKKASQIEHI
jgi:hypothetical protein